MAKLRSDRKIEKPGSFGCIVTFLLVANFQLVGELFMQFKLTSSSVRAELHSKGDYSQVLKFSFT